MISEKHFIVVSCDSCGAPSRCCDQWDDCCSGLYLLPFNAPDVQLEAARRAIADSDQWTEDGEGKIHCPRCERLELTEASKAERARERERAGLTLFEMEGTPS